MISFQHYLREYHYLSPLRNGNHIFKDAVRMFQENAAIPDTGQLDERTIAEMTKPRCGVPDIDEDETSGMESVTHSELKELNIDKNRK